MAGRSFARLTTKRLERREGDALGRNRRRQLFQAFLADSLGKDGIASPKGLSGRSGQCRVRAHPSSDSMVSSDMQPHTFGANNGRSQCALRRTGMNDTMCQNQSQYCPFCGSFAKSPPSWQKKQGTPLRSNCFIRCRVKVMLLVLQSQGMGTIFSKPSR